MAFRLALSRPSLAVQADRERLEFRTFSRNGLRDDCWSWQYIETGIVGEGAGMKRNSGVHNEVSNTLQRRSAHCQDRRLAAGAIPQPDR